MVGGHAHTLNLNNKRLLPDHADSFINYCIVLVRLGVFSMDIVN